MEQKGSSARAQLPGNSKVLAQSTVMQPLAFTHTMMIHFPDIRTCLNLSQLKVLSEQCSGSFLRSLGDHRE